MQVCTCEDRYAFICDRVRHAICYWYSLELVREYDDAVVAICSPPDSHLMDGVFLLPAALFASESYHNPSMRQDGTWDSDPLVCDYSGWGRTLPEKYQAAPQKSFYIG